MEFWRAEQDMTPLAGQIYEAWHGMRGRLADIRVNEEHTGAVRLLKDFATLNLSKYGIERLGIISACLGDAELSDRLTQGKNSPLKKEQVSPDWLLWWGVQLGGTPVLDYPDRGKRPDGPAKVLPQLPTIELRERYGDNLSALQIMSVVLLDAKKMPDSRWARDMSIAINSAIQKFALEHGLERRLKQLTAEVPVLSADAIGEIFERLKTNRDVKSGGTSTPAAESFGDLQKRYHRSHRRTAGLAEQAFTLLASSIHTQEQPGTSPTAAFSESAKPAVAVAALPAPAVTGPEAALQQAVAGDNVKAVVPTAAVVKAASAKPAAKKAAPRKAAAVRKTGGPAAK